MINGVVVLATWPAVALLVVFFAARRQVGLWRTLGALFLATYTLWIVSAAFFPMPVGREQGYYELSRVVNLVPLRYLVRSFGYLGRRQIILQHGGNFLLLVPFTLLGPLLWPRLRSWRWALAIGIGGSATIELLQLAFSALVGVRYRSVDIDDVIVNTAGAIFGYALFVTGRRLWNALRRPPLSKPAGDQRLDQNVR